MIKMRNVLYRTTRGGRVQMDDRVVSVTGFLFKIKMVRSS